MAEINLQYKRAENGPDKEKWVNEENFIRKSLINLYAAPDMGEDVDQVELSPVTTEDVYVLEATTTSDLEFAVEWTASWKTGEREGYILQKVGDETVQVKTVQDIIETFSDSMERKREDAKYNFRTYLTPRSEDIWGKIAENDIELCGRNYSEELDALEKQNAPVWSDQQIMEVVNDKASALFVAHADEEAKNSVFNKYLRRGVWMEGKSRPKYDLKRSNFTNLKNEVKSVDANVYKNRRYMCTFEYDDYRGFMQQYSSQKRPKCFRMKGDVQEKRYGHTEYSEYNRTREEKIKAELQAEIEKTPELKGLSEKKQKEKKMALIALVCSLGLSSMMMVPFLMVLGFVGVVVSFLWYNKVCKANEPGNNATAQAMKDLEAKIAAKYPEVPEYEFEKFMAQKDKENLANRKMELLNARFAKMGYEPLSEEEKGAFLYHVVINAMSTYEYGSDYYNEASAKRDEYAELEGSEYLFCDEEYNAGEFLLDEEDYFIDEE